MDSELKLQVRPIRSSTNEEVEGKAATLLLQALVPYMQKILACEHHTMKDPPSPKGAKVFRENDFQGVHPRYRRGP